MQITGQYGKTYFRNEYTGLTVFSFNTKDIRPCKIKCVGVCQTYSADMPLKLTGELDENGDFRFIDCSPCVDSQDRMITFLSGDHFKGVGEKTAEKICNFVNNDIFSFSMQPNAEELLAKEIGSKTAREVITKVRTMQGANQIFKTIEKYGGNMTHAIRIAEMSNCTEFLDDIYRLGRKGGLSFGCCDSVAKSKGWSPYNSKRIYALLSEALEMITSSGHSYTDIRDITRAVASICKSSAYTDVIPAPYLLSFAKNHHGYKIVNNNGDVRYYSNGLYKAENSVADNIYRLSQSAVSLPFDEKIVHEIEESFGIEYSQSQKRSFNMLKTTGVKILTGGPGTGKSTVIKGIIQAIKKMFPEETPLLCAPTGRAAQRLKEVTGEDSYTIHKALNYRPFEGGAPQYDPITQRFVIIDEASMIDVSVLDILLQSISSASFVLFCGDTNQLPSVGPGDILHDMIDSGKIHTSTLDVVFRQLEDSLINSHAHKIMNGDASVKEGKDFHFFSCSKESDIVKKVKEIAKEKYDKEDIFNFQVLVPAKEGAAGVRSLNKVLQPICNGYDKESSSSSYKFKKFDKVIMMRNNYDGGYMNGDMGVIIDITDNHLIISLGDGKEISINKDNPEDVSPAYALTVHKSQGSEFSSVVVVLPEEPICMLQRNLLYTAITRAKKEVYIISQNKAYEKSVETIKLAQRNTSLKEKIERGTFIYA